VETFDCKISTSFKYKMVVSKKVMKTVIWDCKNVNKSKIEFWRLNRVEKGGRELWV